MTHDKSKKIKKCRFKSFSISDVVVNTHVAGHGDERKGKTNTIFKEILCFEQLSTEQKRRFYKRNEDHEIDVDEELNDEQLSNNVDKNNCITLYI